MPGDAEAYRTGPDVRQLDDSRCQSDHRATIAADRPLIRQVGGAMVPDARCPQGLPDRRPVESLDHAERQERCNAPPDRARPSSRCCDVPSGESMMQEHRRTSGHGRPLAHLPLAHLLAHRAHHRSPGAQSPRMTTSVGSTKTSIASPDRPRCEGFNSNTLSVVPPSISIQCWATSPR